MLIYGSIQMFQIMAIQFLYRNFKKVIIISVRFVPRVSFYWFRQSIRNPGLTLYNFALGFYLNPNVIGDWSTGKSTCEGMGMQLASLKSSALNAAAIKYITVQQSFGQATSTFQLFFDSSIIFLHQIQELPSMIK